ncbi:MAG: helix-turn-helix domain-containing protein [Rhodobacteraceae bacterium]|nr:helix-turn-helix domain-containing protein [Paracoccaceae bacterium]
MKPKSQTITPRTVRSVDELGRALRAVRKAKGMTQGDLARITGLQAHHISTIETGTTRPTAATIFILLSALDLDFVLSPRGDGNTGKSSNIEDIF